MKNVSMKKTKFFVFVNARQKILLLILPRLFSKIVRITIQSTEFNTDIRNMITQKNIGVTYISKTAV